MKLNALNRKIHYWASIAVALPLLVVISTGILLHLKKQLAWVQPPERKGTEGAPSLPFERVLEIARSVPQAQIEGWDDINRIDVRPDRGMMKVRAQNEWEIQIDTTTGEILQVAYRRSDVLESIHDGSFFTVPIKYAVFLPAGLTLLVLWATGIYMFALPFLARLRRRTVPRVTR